MTVQPFVLHLHVSPGDAATAVPVQANGNAPAAPVKLPAPVPVDPRAYARAFPDLWQRYIRAAFAGPDAVANICMVHGCDESTARAWLEGRGGCHGRHVAIAMSHNPALATETLFHMAAE